MGYLDKSRIWNLLPSKFHFRQSVERGREISSLQLAWWRAVSSDSIMKVNPLCWRSLNYALFIKAARFALCSPDQTSWLERNTVQAEFDQFLWVRKEAYNTAADAGHDLVRERLWG